MIEISDVNMTFGKETVLRHVSLSVERGRIIGLTGNNGSGKTVLLKCICGLFKPQSGKIVVDGKRVGIDVDFPQDLGAIIEAPGFLPHKSGYANLDYLRRLRKKVEKSRISSALSQVGLDKGAARKHVGKYSMGMKQRLGIAQAIMEDPDVIILDEPMNGLDNAGVREMRELFKSLRAQGKTIIISSHNREDIDELCDNVYEMDAGILTKVR